uniref:C-type lectin domain-containing protein n=1 Tax=Chromera velia CCMP2878 TaxID=1169474 RepID=A0A0G4G6U3_9ALVE|eukprot:Cvel_4239.t1-p1 / transcript=Cvel_4239.t1 / gene=Cvel_4239 / organism=Chromera_velia_CCMP2878 / gene_product=hypothetical protein / transcript_product=hypothetical protein / location=Cvel_scaffold183:81049-101181(+) / protein_length=2412 / sequence_SO=supercontig / SO=protein_coding / is_pseudo=false
MRIPYLAVLCVAGSLLLWRTAGLRARVEHFIDWGRAALLSSVTLSVPHEDPNDETFFSEHHKLKTRKLVASGFDYLKAKWSQRDRALVYDEGLSADVNSTEGTTYILDFTLMTATDDGEPPQSVSDRKGAMVFWASPWNSALSTLNETGGSSWALPNSGAADRRVSVFLGWFADPQLAGGSPPARNYSWVPMRYGPQTGGWSVGGCAAACSEYAYFGLAFSDGKCFCDGSFEFISSVSVPLANSLLCSGDLSETATNRVACRSQADGFFFAEALRRCVKLFDPSGAVLTSSPSVDLPALLSATSSLTEPAQIPTPAPTAANHSAALTACQTAGGGAGYGRLAEPSTENSGAAWRWQDGTPPLSSLWVSSPSDGQNCAAIGRDAATEHWGWIAVDCADDSNAFFCESDVDDVAFSNYSFVGRVAPIDAHSTVVAGSPGTVSFPSTTDLCSAACDADTSCGGFVLTSGSGDANKGWREGASDLTCHLKALPGVDSNTIPFLRVRADERSSFFIKASVAPLGPPTLSLTRLSGSSFNLHAKFDAPISTFDESKLQFLVSAGDDGEVTVRALQGLGRSLAGLPSPAAPTSFTLFADVSSSKARASLITFIGQTDTITSNDAAATTVIEQSQQAQTADEEAALEFYKEVAGDTTATTGRRRMLLGDADEDGDGEEEEPCIGLRRILSLFPDANTNSTLERLPLCTRHRRGIQENTVEVESSTAGGSRRQLSTTSSIVPGIYSLILSLDPSALPLSGSLSANSLVYVPSGSATTSLWTSHVSSTGRQTFYGESSVTDGFTGGIAVHLDPSFVSANPQIAASGVPYVILQFGQCGCESDWSKIAPLGQASTLGVPCSSSSDAACAEVFLVGSIQCMSGQWNYNGVCLDSCPSVEELVPGLHQRDPDASSLDDLGIAWIPHQSASGESSCLLIHSEEQINDLSRTISGLKAPSSTSRWPYVGAKAACEGLLGGSLAKLDLPEMKQTLDAFTVSFNYSLGDLWVARPMRCGTEYCTGSCEAFTVRDLSSSSSGGKGSSGKGLWECRVYSSTSTSTSSGRRRRRRLSTSTTSGMVSSDPDYELYFNTAYFSTVAPTFDSSEVVRAAPTGDKRSDADGVLQAQGAVAFGPFFYPPGFRRRRGNAVVEETDRRERHLTGVNREMLTLRARMAALLEAGRMMRLQQIGEGEAFDSGSVDIVKVSALKVEMVTEMRALKDALATAGAFPGGRGGQRGQAPVDRIAALRNLLRVINEDEEEAAGSSLEGYASEADLNLPTDFLVPPPCAVPVYVSLCVGIGEESGGAAGAEWRHLPGQMLAWCNAHGQQLCLHPAIQMRDPEFRSAVNETGPAVTIDLATLKAARLETEEGGGGDSVCLSLFVPLPGALPVSTLSWLWTKPTSNAPARVHTALQQLTPTERGAAGNDPETIALGDGVLVIQSVRLQPVQSHGESEAGGGDEDEAEGIDADELLLMIEASASSARRLREAQLQTCQGSEMPSLLEDLEEMQIKSRLASRRLSGGGNLSTDASWFAFSGPVPFCACDCLVQGRPGHVWWSHGGMLLNFALTYEDATLSIAPRDALISIRDATKRDRKSSILTSAGNRRRSTFSVPLGGILGQRQQPESSGPSGGDQSLIQLDAQKRAEAGSIRFSAMWAEVEGLDTTSSAGAGESHEGGQNQETGSFFIVPVASLAEGTETPATAHDDADRPMRLLPLRFALKRPADAQRLLASEANSKVGVARQRRGNMDPPGCGNAWLRDWEGLHQACFLDALLSLEDEGGESAGALSQLELKLADGTGIVVGFCDPGWAAAFAGSVSRMSAAWTALSRAEAERHAASGGFQRGNTELGTAHQAGDGRQSRLRNSIFAAVTGARGTLKGPQRGSTGAAAERDAYARRYRETLLVGRSYTGVGGKRPTDVERPDKQTDSKGPQRPVFVSGGAHGAPPPPGLSPGDREEDADSIPEGESEGEGWGWDGENDGEWPTEEKEKSPKEELSASGWPQEDLFAVGLAPESSVGSPVEAEEEDQIFQDEEGRPGSAPPSQLPAAPPFRERADESDVGEESQEEEEGESVESQEEINKTQENPTEALRGSQEAWGDSGEIAKKRRDRENVAIETAEVSKALSPEELYDLAMIAIRLRYQKWSLWKLLLRVTAREQPLVACLLFDPLCPRFERWLASLSAFLSILCGAAFVLLNIDEDHPGFFSFEEKRISAAAAPDNSLVVGAAFALCVLSPAIEGGLRFLFFRTVVEVLPGHPLSEKGKRRQRAIWRGKEQAGVGVAILLSLAFAAFTLLWLRCALVETVSSWVFITSSAVVMRILLTPLTGSLFAWALLVVSRSSQRADGLLVRMPSVIEFLPWNGPAARDKRGSVGGFVDEENREEGSDGDDGEGLHFFSVDVEGSVEGEEGKGTEREFRDHAEARREERAD